MNRITVSIAILFLLVLLLNIPGWIEQAPQPVQGNQDDSLLPNYQAKNLQSTLYDDDGRLSHQVFADTAEHFDLLGLTLFEQPQYRLFNEEQQQPWVINAESGALYDTNRIQLETDVLIRSLNSNDFVQSIRTQYIEIDLTNRTMQSDQDVVIIGKDFIIESKGFSANLVSRQFELHEHVQTRISPSLVH